MKKGKSLRKPLKNGTIHDSRFEKIESRQIHLIHLTFSTISVALALCYHKNDDDSEVKDIFIEHVIHKSIETQRKYPKFKDFIDYMNDTWIESVDESKGPLFKISWWNHWYHMEIKLILIFGYELNFFKKKIFKCQ